MRRCRLGDRVRSNGSSSFDGDGSCVVVGLSSRNVPFLRGEKEIWLDGYATRRSVLR